MRLNLRRLWRLRPRLLTLVVMAVVAGMIMLANLTDEFRDCGHDVLVGPGQVQFSPRDPGPDPFEGAAGAWKSLSYGWPLLWRQYILWRFWMGPLHVLGECFSPSRLVCNLAIWLVMLAAPGAACEWLLRRRRRRFQWLLRTMLAAIGLVAALCGWFAAARSRADLQDAVIADCVDDRLQANRVWVKHRGPRWLDLVGADRYRRVVVGAALDLTVDLTDEFKVDEADCERKKELLGRLTRLRDLRYLFIQIDDQSPDLAEALRSMPQLQVLGINIHDFDPDAKLLSHNCLVAIGAMSNLKHLRLRGPPAIGESLDCLAGLTNLNSLGLEVLPETCDEADPPLLARLPSLPRLQHIELQESYVGHRGLRHLRVLPRLKKLNLIQTDIAFCDSADLPRLRFDPGLADLASLEFLEEVAVAGDIASATGLESLLALKHLKRLHNGGPDTGRYGMHATAQLTLDNGDEVTVLESELDRCRRALDALRQANPEIVIDGDLRASDSLVRSTDWPGELLVPTEYETIPDETLRESALHGVGEWKKGVRLPIALWPQPGLGPGAY